MYTKKAAIDLYKRFSARHLDYYKHRICTDYVHEQKSRCHTSSLFTRSVLPQSLPQSM